MSNSKIKTKVNLDSNETIKKKRKMEQSGEGQLAMSYAVKRLSDPYVPFQDGTLKDTTCIVTAEGLEYLAPYAQRMWYGKVMAGNPLEATDKDISFQGAPMRGAFWTTRMMADKGKDVVEATVKVTGGRVK